MTNITAAIVLVMFSTNVIRTVHPSNTEMHEQQVISETHVYQLNGLNFTNLVATRSNPPTRMVWKPEPIARQPLALSDLPPIPTGLSITNSTNQP